MDPITVAATVVALLSVHLVEGNEARAKKACGALWAALEHRFHDRPAAEEVLNDLKTTPQDPDTRAALRRQLKKILTADPQFLKELVQLLEEAQAESSEAVHYVTITLRGSGAIAQGPGAVAAGAGGVAVGGTIHGDIIVTDDNDSE
jgi:hypothetical protein